jgi:hypothetical protein
VQATDVATIAALNPRGGACENQLRPGLAARMRFPGGLDLATVSRTSRAWRIDMALD